MRSSFPIARRPIVTWLDDQGISRKISEGIHAKYYAWHQSGGVSEALAKSHILDFFFQCQSETVLDARLQIGDDFAQLLRRTLTLVVDQVGVILRHANAAVSDSLGAHLLQKICGRHLPFPDYTLRPLPLHGFRKLRQDQVLKYAAGALHGGGIF